MFSYASQVIITLLNSFLKSVNFHGWRISRHSRKANANTKASLFKHRFCHNQLSNMFASLIETSSEMPVENTLVVGDSNVWYMKIASPSGASVAVNHTLRARSLDFKEKT